MSFQKRLGINMKKQIFILCSILVIISSCKISQRKELESPGEKVSEALQENVPEVVQENNLKVQDIVENDSSSSFAEDSVLNSKSWKSIVHEESITFYADYIEDPFFDAKMLSVWKDKIALYYYYYAPDLHENEIVYKIQPGDTIKITEFLTHKTMDGTILHVECPDGKTGYIYYHDNIFTKNEYFFQESIEVDGISKDVYSVSGPVYVKQKEVYELPSVNSEIVHELSFDGGYVNMSVHVISMTDDGEWVKVKIENSGVVGWVPYESLESGMCGPVIWTPYMRMIWDMFNYYDKI